MTTDLTTAFTADRCDLHDISSCADCARKAGLRRDRQGQTRYDKDCAVATFSELTELPYADAAEIMLAAGFSPRKGTPEANIVGAFRDSGYTVTEVTRQLTPEAALAVTALDQTKAFFVAGYKGKRAHAWSIHHGQYHRAYRPPYRYRIYEVTKP